MQLLVFTAISITNKVLIIPSYITTCDVVILVDTSFKITQPISVLNRYLLQLK